MANYCSNAVTFMGKNSEKALSHFASMGDNTPPYLEIFIHKGIINFESRWVPPIRDLNRLAEKFNVSYKLDYHIPHEDRETFVYTCLQQEPLVPMANKIRDIISKAETREELENLDLMVKELIEYRTFNLHDLGLLTCVLNHRFNQMGFTTSVIPVPTEKTELNPWEKNDLSTEKKRSR
ncbi:hypothetical protein [Sphingobacterium mizutaii]|uniref:hypothetical protein n=1 Tax=Sphingobacterium mizutaii TaxID=1010 RepID=UPI0016253126|nr:hypothetical protein [Sphingobacterium mizutaii]